MSEPDAKAKTAIALTIAGSDSGGGAGIQADLKAFSALGVFGASVITAVTAQNTRAVTAVHGIPTDVIEAQIRAVLDDLTVDAIKIGMLSTAGIIDAVASSLETFEGPIVLDPVMVAKSGDRLLEQNAVDALKVQLMPLATLITPNLPEAAVLLDGVAARDVSEAKEQGLALLEAGARAVLMKGGHAPDENCTDWLVTPEGCESFTATRIDTKNTHGTGCTLSSSVAAGMAKGLSLRDSIADAHSYLHKAIEYSDQLQIGHGHGPVHHFHSFW
ncbi:MAG: bifunctional hydroxymethylpyrimidine kinase/phosphomethylpyrimidine kinase [Pseudomonadota bacterium]